MNKCTEILNGAGEDEKTSDGRAYFIKSCRWSSTEHTLRACRAPRKGDSGITSQIVMSLA